MLSLMACVKEVITLPSETVDADGEIVLNISAVVPEAKIATKGTFTAPTITSLNVLMFDDKGFMVANAVALNKDGSEWADKDVTDDKVEFKVTLPKTGNSCTLHFVANAGVSTVEYGMETDVITSLATAGTKDAYWQKVNLPRLIDEDDLTAKCPVQLIRNHAKVTLVSTVEKFKPTGYALINYPTSGTVAPYNTTTGKFQVYNNGNVGKNFEDLVTDNYSAFMPADCDFSGVTTDNIDWTSLTVDNDLKVSGAPLYTYESAYGNTFLLVKGRFDYNNDGEFEESESFYKIDFYDPSLGNCDILRNINYQFSITNVIGSGYPSVAEAANPDVPAGNNISNSLLTQSLINISDGTQRLSVEYTSKYLTSADPFTLKYMFQPDLKSNTTINTLSDGTITIATEVTDKYDSEDIKYNVLDPGKTNGYSTIQIEPQDFPVEGQIYSKRITITSKYDGVTMSRIVDLYFIHAYEMTVACDPKKVAASAGSAVTVRTTIPGNLPSVLFPLVFDIESDKMSLYPDTAKELAANESENAKSMPVVSGTSTINGVDKNTFHYQRTLTEEEYRALGGKPGEANISNITFNSYFKTSTAKSASKVYVSNPYFTQGYDNFDNAKSFEPLAFPNGVKATPGSATTFTFSMSTTDPVTVTLTGLEPADNRLVAVTRADGTYTYTPTASGTQVLNLKTTDDGSITVKVELAADAYDYAPAYLEANQANSIIIPAGNITFKTNRSGSYDISVYADSQYSDLIITLPSVAPNSKNAEINLGEVSLQQTIYFRYYRNSSYYKASATVESLLAGGVTLDFKN